MSNERIDITASIFTAKPAFKFAETMKVPIALWDDLYRRYGIGYSKADLKEWFEFKTKKTISYKTISRWIIRQELYDDVHEARSKGAKIVTAQYFKRNIEVIPELLEEDTFTEYLRDRFK